MSINRNFIFIINDFHGHGGHVKSFVSQISTIFNDVSDYKIICTEDGYISRNQKNIEFAKEDKMIYFPLQNVVKYQFSYDLYNLLKSLLSDNYIIHTYSMETYFVASLAKIKFKNISVITSVMGGQNPFPYLSSMDLYFAVSEEQKNDAVLNSNKPDEKTPKIAIIKNRIEIDLKNQVDTKNDDSIILVITRFDVDKKPSLDKTVEILKNLPTEYKVIIAGKGSLLSAYKIALKEYTNIHFIGYCANLSAYRNDASLVIGMGRSILEFMFYGTPAILIGYKGIEILDTIDSVSFASKYNFSGRTILNSKSLNEVIEYITICIENKNILNDEIISFLEKEYDANYFKSKYFKEIKHLGSSNTSKVELLNEYRHIFFIRLMRKINHLLRNK